MVTAALGETAAFGAVVDLIALILGAFVRLGVLAVVVALGSGVLSVSPAEAAAAARPYDFNGDGYPELVVGAPDLQVGSVKGAGGVVVLPASARGLSLNEKVITQSSRGVPGASEIGDIFGKAVASADFDRDGYADLAVGQPTEAAGTVREVGTVSVIYGSSRGLDTNCSRRLGPTSETGNTTSKTHRFGDALAAGDFDRDGFSDLAIGAPLTDLQGYIRESPSGSVTVMSGGPNGLSSTDPVFLRHQRGGAPDPGFGSKLAAGDLDRDGGTDLIVYGEGWSGAGAPLPSSLSYCPGRVGGPIGCTHLVYDYAIGEAQSLAVGKYVR